MMMTITTTFHHHHHHHPLVLSAISSPSSSSFDFQFASHIGKRRRGTRIGGNLNPYSFITCRGLEDCSSSMSSRTKSSDFYRSSFSASYGRRGFTLMTSISVVFPLYWSTELLAAGELSIIQKGVTDVLSKAKAAGVLRMVFHDAGTFDMDDNSGGMNGSIVYELDRPENDGLSKTLKEHPICFGNSGLKNYSSVIAKILEKAKREIDKIQQVSWADLIAVAGAEAVSLCGGPAIPVRLGRFDVRMPDPQGKLPQESLDAFGLKRCFLKKGFSTQELVALSGAHTLGSKGFGDPNVFDNAYFKILIEKPWTSSAGMPNMIGLPSDRALVEDDECLRWIRIYAADEVRFFDDFKNAYNKLVNSGALWRSV